LVHAIALLLGILIATGFLINWFLDRQNVLIHPKPFQYLAFYVGILGIQCWIAWEAWFRFKECSFSSSLVSYVIWFFFLFYGWFNPRSPAWQRDFDPTDTAQMRTEHLEMIFIFIAWALIYAVFPFLRYTAFFKDRRRV
jgi:hypothetical protein